MLFGIDKRNPAATAVIEAGGGAHSYGKLCADARAVGDAATAAFGGRSLAFCLCKNTYGSFSGYVGLMDAGIVPLLLDAELDRGLLGGLLERYRPSLLWLPEEHAGRFPAYACLLRADGYALLETGNPPCTLAEELALLLTTSGSTGSPKLVRQSMRNIRANAESIVTYLEIGEDERAVTTLPMQYTYGLSILHSHLLAGAAVLMTQGSMIQRDFWAFFREQGATSFGGVPYSYELLRRAGFFEMALPSLRYFTQAGGKLPEAMHKACAEYARAQGKRFYVMYGQAEATARMGYLPWRMAEEKCGSMGIAIPGGRFTLVDAQGGELTEPDTVGELVYRGNNVTLGYAEEVADLARGDDRGGVLQTGDMARFDADGYYYIVGRKKRFIKLFGVRVGLDGCEQLLKARFPGIDCACYGKDDLMRVRITDQALCTQAGEFLAATLRIHHSGFEVGYLAELPKTSAGKTLYTALEELL